MVDSSKQALTRLSNNRPMVTDRYPTNGTPKRVLRPGRRIDHKPSPATPSSSRTPPVASRTTAACPGLTF